MTANRDKVDRWKEDIGRSVDFYNEWFLRFAPDAFRSTRVETTGQVESALAHTANLTALNPDALRYHPEVLPILRMATCPPIARDRLIGLSGASPQLVKSMENEKRLPPRLGRARTDTGLTAICDTIRALLDPDIIAWKDREAGPSQGEVYRAAIVIADRLCGSIADPIIRNAQERRQLAAIATWLGNRGYRQVEAASVRGLTEMVPGTFAFRLNVPVRLTSSAQRTVNIPIDVVAKSPQSAPDELPVLIEAKSAGDFTNVNKRRKEEATKMAQLRANYGETVPFVLFLCGYFDSGYLGYEAAEGIDWAWEHRIDDLMEFGL